MVVNVLVEINIGKKDKTFSYLVPDNLKDKVDCGKRVLIPFGKQVIEGFILEIINEKDNDLKEIIDVIDEERILNEELLKLGKEISDMTVSNLVSIYQAMLPKGYKASKKSNVKEKLVGYIRIIDKEKAIDFIKTSKAKKQIEIVEKLLNKELESKLFSSQTINSLINKGIIEKYYKEEYRLKDELVERVVHELNEYQMEAYNQINNSNKDVILLNGVTGSGKTEIYMKLIDDQLKKGKEAIMLVPEISLTPQIIDRFRAHFKENIAILHSALSDGEKYDEYRKILRKEVKIVVGARSAIFAPFTNIGIIIIDEEHSNTYKQDHNPRYNAIEVAFIRGKTYNAKVILGSATPTIESYARGKKGYYELVKLDKRANNASLPIVNIIDMSKELRKGNRIFSKELLLNIEDRLNKQEQVMLLLNKRGYSSYLMCEECGEVLKCPHCDITLTYHKTSDMNRCHYCGFAKKNNHKCDKCNKESLKLMGYGTEKVEEELNKLFPEARVLRMDIDTTSKKGSHKTIIEKFNNHEADILVGTQMIAKGLDFPLVTLVGVINADTILNLPDFRSCERTYDLLSQVSGRAGRSSIPGKVIVQTYNPDNYSIKLSKSHNFEKFFEEEIKIRKKLYYPPYSFIALIKVGGKEYSYSINEATKIANYIRKKVDKEIVLGPSAASLSKINNIYYFEIIIKYRDKENIINLLNEVKLLTENNNKIKVEFDINPNSF
ncbi:MAG: primosomal protein N' [Bacilli bacterium]|nr:primosomal protein N' [Bacilli bacterium]